MEHICGCRVYWKFHKRTDLPALGIVWVLVFGLFNQISNGDTGIVSEFPSRESSKTPLNKLVVDRDAVFIGAVNNLYKLNKDLQELQSTQTGPVLDNRACVDWEDVTSKETCPSNTDQTLVVYDTDLVNKVLLIDPNQRVLITCWNVYQGACQIRQLSNISQAISKNERNRYVPVVPNDDTSPAVAFFGPGPYSSSGDDALYIGATYPSDFKQQGNGELFYVVSTRLVSGSKFFDIANKDVLNYQGTYKHLTDSWDTYSYSSPKYIGGFSADSFNYFFTVQTKYVPNTEGTNMVKTEEYISKIARVCGRDEVYISYIEMELECKVGSTKYNLVQDVTLATPGKNLAGRLGISTSDPVIFATFAKGEEPPDNSKPTSESALCIYSLKDVTDKFTENIKACYRGEGYLVPLYATDFTLKCFPISNVNIDNNFCGNTQDPTVNQPIEGGQAMSAEPVLTTSDRQLTAVAVDIVNDHTVTFIGTSKGSLMKVLVGPTSSASLYNEVMLNRDLPILSDMMFSNQHDYLYAMSEQKVYKVSIETCSQFKNCGDCLGAKDPYCGWCTLENKCTRYSECQNAVSLLRWLSSHESPQCVTIRDVEPKSAPHSGDATTVTVTVDQLPPNTGGYQCMFGNAVAVMANEQNDKLSCSPRLGDLPEISEGETTLNVTLSIKALDTDIEFLSTPFTFYECLKYTSCSSCAGSTWGCRWCVHDNACVDHRATCATVISGPIMDDLYCPRLETSGPILLPAGQSREIHLDAHNLPQPMTGQGGYDCHIHFPSTTITIPARREDNQRIVCSSTQFGYTSNEGQIETEIQVVWNRDFVIDDKIGLKGIVYKCENMGTDCSLCNNLFTSQPKYGCKFCGGQCRFNATCTSPHSSTCPAPTVENVYPSTSTVHGGTKITIEGSNLGSSYSQVTAVTIGNVPCDLVAEEYEPAKRIVCITGPKTLSSAEVRVQIGGTTGSWAGHLFHYQEPHLEMITPNKGPMAGGTRLTVMGRKMNTGLVIKVYLDEKECLVLRDEVTDETVICLTPEMPGARTTMKVIVIFDGHRKELNAAFTYLPNPNITMITPLKSYASGGRIITVMGEHFKIVNSPKIFARFEGRESSKSECKTKSSTEMTCETPSVCNLVPLNEFCKEPVLTANRRRRQTSNAVELGFEMDNVESVNNLSKFFPELESTLEVFPDPVYHNFTGGVREYKGESLKLTGSNLNLACTKEEVKVTIGGQPCEVYSMGEVDLHCRPPEKQPLAKDDDPRTLPQVEVRVGRLMWTPGKLRYMSPSLYFPPSAIIGIVVGASILVLIIIIILIVYKRKSSEAERQYKKMQIQLDTLESNVRNECKQAFAELQTEVSDLTSDLNVTGIPFWDYKTYTFKVLFPSHQDHPVLHKKLDVADTKLGGYEQGLAQFNQLLNSKQFLLIFIRTLEFQKNFSIRDKAQVASLLMIVLQDKMEYATEILKALLNELIDRSVEKKHPKLMLRRMESVVEKLLTNWMSICMYSYIKRHAGRNLYMLYKAIKQQTEKGPVDAITSEARYSLSEDRLLREKIDHKVLNINLVVEGQQSDPVMCRVLDCDTITQSKEKALDAVYMNTPFSRRPSVFDVDLEWRSGRSGHLPLQDEDVTTELIRNWKRVNTLAHYHVPDGATMALVPKRNKNDYIRQVHGMVQITSGGSFSNLNPIVTVEEGTKVWHLVKHDDSQNQSRTQKVISEIFLTRLLATKGTVQQFIDDLFLTVLKVDNTLPPAIKYLFDFLDQAARRHNIVDAEVVHTWKSNSLPLRFWVNIIKNPEFVFDIHKSHITDSCLSVIAQTFMDSCSTSEHRLGKDSPSNKLLFAKDITKYRKWVEKYYRDIQEMPPVSDFEMNRTMTELSMSNMVDFNVSCALKELYRYATQYNFELLESLDDDPSAKKLHLANKFEQVAAMIDGSPLY